MSGNPYDDSNHVTNPSVSTHLEIKRLSLQTICKPAKEVDIDFNAASTAWLANKIRKGEQFYYRCTAIQKNGNQCIKKSTANQRCKMHSKVKT